MPRKWIILFLPLSSLTIALFAGLAPVGNSDSENPLGKSLYYSHCYRCHGDDGDAADYYNIIPLAGIARRPPVGLVGRFRNDAFSARGVEFSADRASALRDYLFALPGRKGFADPGWLWSPYLLSCKSALVNECRILDVRDKDAYNVDHIPNAVSVSPDMTEPEQRLPEQSILEFLREAGIEEDTQIVLYDSDGGLKATWLWWNLTKAGHPYVAILDGGWKNWKASGFPSSEVIPSIEPTNYQFPKDEDRPPNGREITVDRHLEWNWKDTFESEGLKDGEHLNQLILEIGLDKPGIFRLDCSPKEAAHLLFVLRLLARDARIVSSKSEELCLLFETEAEK